MKKFISLTICISLILTVLPVAPFAADAKSDTPSPITYRDFDDNNTSTYCKMTQSYEYVTASDGSSESRGKSLHIYSKDYDNDTDANDTSVLMYTYFDTQGVFGFSYFTADSNARFTVAAKGLDGWSAGVTGLVVVEGAKVTGKGGGEYTGKLNTWTNVAVAIDYSNGTSKGMARVYVNGKLIDEYQTNTSVVNTNYFNITVTQDRYTDVENAVTNKDYASFYFDDLYAYHSSSALISDKLSSASLVDFNLTETSVDFNQKIISASDGVITLNGTPVTFEPITKHGYIIGAKLKNLSLAGNTDYTLKATGFTDLFAVKPDMKLNFTTADDSPVISINFANDSDKTAKHPAGTIIDLDVSSLNLKGSSVNLYRNGKPYQTLLSSDTKAEITLDNGKNAIYACADVDGKTCKSNILTVYTTSYDVVLDYVSEDFNSAETGSAYSTTRVYKADSNSEWDDLQVVKETNGNRYLHIKPDNTKFTFRTVKYDDFSDDSASPQAVYVFEMDIKFTDVSKVAVPIETKFFIDSNTTAKVINNFRPLVENGKAAGTEVTVNTTDWYNFKFVYDLESPTKTESLYVNGKPAVYNRVISSDTPPIAYNYINQHVQVGEELYFDNIKIYFMSRKASTAVDFGSANANDVPYDNGAVNLTFDRKMDESSLKTVPVKSSDGEVVSEIEFKAADSSGMLFGGRISSLEAKTEYSLDLSSVKTSLGAGVLDAEQKFTTSKLPFCIDDVTANESSDKVAVKIDIRNLTQSQQTADLLIGLFSGNKLITADYANYSGSSSDSKQISFDKPNETYEVRVFMFDAVSSLKLIDKYAD